MGDQHDLGLLVVTFLPDGFDGDQVIGEDQRDGGEHARTVGHPHQDVVLGVDALQREGLSRRELGRSLWRDGRAGHAPSSQLDDVPDYGRGRRITARAQTVEHQRAHPFTFDVDGVEALAD